MVKEEPMTTKITKTNKHGLAYKLSLLVLSSTSLIFIAAFSYNYWCSSKIVLDNVHENAKSMTAATVNKIEAVITGVENTPDFLAAQLENGHIEKKTLFNCIEKLVTLNEEIFGSTVSFEPYVFDPEVRLFGPYFYRKDGAIAYTDLSKSYDYLIHDWYLQPKELNKTVWSEPYFDEGGGEIIMSTYSVPFYRTIEGKRIVQGVVTADISLEWLVGIISSISFLDNGYAFLVADNGVFVTHPDNSFIMKESIFSLADKHNDENLRAIGKKMAQGEEGFVPYKSIHLKKKCWMYYASLPTTKWSIGIVFPEDELFANLYSLSRTVFIIGVIGFLLLFVVIILISGAIAKPIRNLANMTADIAKGNLDIELPKSSSSDEIGALSHSFENMRVALKEYISDLTETTAAKERIESELKIAHNIQMNFLPKIFPPFPEKEEFEIFATLEPAKEVGGDLYDFFLLDDNHLFFSIGDVTDKGVPAALFMAVSKTLMKGIAEQGKQLGYTPADVLMKVNDELAHDNETSMFVTVICGFLNIKTGLVVYSNAAHNPPVLIRANSKPEWLALPPGFLLGPMEGSKYSTMELQLNPGDSLLLYTDGVDEAMNINDEFYTKDKILRTVEASQAETAEELVKDVMNSVKEFSKGAAQSDDITLVGLHYKGSS